MPRVTDGRLPAEPSSAGQKDRYRRMLLAAARLAAQHDFDHVQMHDVAKDSGVAIATLYRYFPSKAHLFTAVMRWEVDRFESLHPAATTSDPASAIAELLVAMSREMVRRPRLSLAMIQGNNLNQAQMSAAGRQGDNDILFQQIVLDTAGLGTPSADELQMIRLVIHCWYGVLTSVLNGRLELEDAESDIRTSCRLLLSLDAAARAPRG